MAVLESNESHYINAFSFVSRRELSSLGNKGQASCRCRFRFWEKARDALLAVEKGEIETNYNTHKTKKIWWHILLSRDCPIYLEFKIKIKKEHGTVSYPSHETRQRRFDANKRPTKKLFLIIPCGKGTRRKTFKGKISFSDSQSCVRFAIL